MQTGHVIGAMVALSGAAVALAWLGPPGIVAAAAALAAQIWLVAHHLRRGTAPASYDTAPMPPVDTTVRIGSETLHHMRQGLNERSAQQITDIILRITEVDAVAITDTEQILGFSGIGCRRHRQGGPILTTGTRRVLQSNQTMVVQDPSILSCPEPDCPHPLKSAVITPLRFRGAVVGTFKIYRTAAQSMPAFLVAMAEGISQILGLQLELAEVEHQRQLITKARLEALQAQIRPHFLFNVLNTIIMFSRTDVERARELLTQLSSFFRRSLSYRGHFITLQDEMEYINTYLTLEKARYGNHLNVRLRIDPKILNFKVPILTVQPLVENAVVHGLAPKEGGGSISVSARRVGSEVHISIIDNGVGMDRETLRKVFEDGFGTGMGLGMSNVNERLISLYGEQSRLRVRSRPGWGTAVRVRIPLDVQVVTLPDTTGEAAATIAAVGEQTGGGAPT